MLEQTLQSTGASAITLSMLIEFDVAGKALAFLDVLRTVM